MSMRRTGIGVICLGLVGVAWIGGCKRVAVRIDEHQTRHRHVWAARYCDECAAECMYCHGCGRYRHTTVTVHVDRDHVHAWRTRWCDRCDGECRFCGGCDSVRHRTVSVRVERPGHEHHWKAKFCKKHRQECRVCTSCKKIRHAVAPPKPPPGKHRRGD